MNTMAWTHFKFLSALVSVLLFASESMAKDAFGLDDYKHSVDSITKPDTRYLTKYGNQLNIYSIQNETVEGSSLKEPVRFLVQGGLHGNELLGSEFVGWLAQRFAAGKSLLNKLNLGKVAIDFLPYANPDGTIQFTRYNGNKINLNRNFSVLWGETKENPGQKPFSESETRAIRDMFKIRNYTGSIDVHGYINWIVIPTSPEDSITGLPVITNEKLAQYRKWVKAITRETSNKLPGYEIKTAGGLGDGGAFEDYAWWEANVPSACLEIFSRDRYVPTTIAGKIMDLLTPKAFAINRNLDENSDTFMVYENYVFSLFNEAIKLKEISKDKSKMSASTLPMSRKIMPVN